MESDILLLILYEWRLQHLTCQTLLSQDLDIRYYSWNILTLSACIFIAVLASDVVNQMAKRFLFSGIHVAGWGTVTCTCLAGENLKDEPNRQRMEMRVLGNAGEIRDLQLPAAKCCSTVFFILTQPERVQFRCHCSDESSLNFQRSSPLLGRLWLTFPWQ